MYQLELTKKMQGDDLKGVITINGVDIYSNIDALSIAEASAYMDDIREIYANYKRNPENPVYKKNLEKTLPILMKAIRILFDEEERDKLRKQNPTNEDLQYIIGGVLNLYQEREEKLSKN